MFFVSPSDLGGVVDEKAAGLPVLGLTLCFGLRPALAAEAGVFSDVRDSDWFAPYVRVCVDHGLMEGTGAGRFEPDRELTLMEVWALEAKLEAWARGESVPHFPVVSLSDLAVFYDGTGAPAGNHRRLYL